MVLIDYYYCNKTEHVNLISFFVIPNQNCVQLYRQHPPTGQVNMSRIAHNLIDVELDTPDASFGHKVYIYAVNYNVLRISSGLGGLKF